MRRPPAVTPPRPQKQSRCRLCGRTLPAWLPMARHPESAMLLHHLEDLHPGASGPSLARMATEDIGTVAAEAYEVVEGPA
jgi:hypothetical protein